MTTGAEPLAREAEGHEGLALDITPRKLAVFGLFVVLTVVALYFLLPQIAGLDKTWKRIQHGRPWWLILGGILTFGMFAGYVMQFHAIYQTRLGWRESLQITMASLAASRLFSAGGAGGLVLQAWALRRAGLDAREVGDRTVCFIVLQYLVYTLSVVVVGFGLHYGLFNGPDPFAITFVPAVIALVVTAVGLSLGFIPPDLQKRLDEGRLKRLAQIPASASAGIRAALRRLTRPDAALVGAIFFWGFQIAVLWSCFHAFGDAPPLAVLVLGFFVGMLGNLLPLPGGIGGVDGGMIGAFAALGLPFGLSTVAVLTYRGFTFWLPTIPGVIAFIALRRTIHQWEEDGPPVDGTPSYT